MEEPRLIPPPNWTSIFTLHPELDPPGYAEMFIFMAERRGARKPKRSKARGKEKKSPRFPSLKHGVD
jgi:hypothetical protein